MTKMSLRTPDFLIQIREDCNDFGSAFRQIALCMIQFARAVFSENCLCILEFSILVKMLHNIFGHNTDYACDFVLFCACLPATVLHDLLKARYNVVK